MNSEEYLKLKKIIDDSILDLLPLPDMKSATLTDAMKYSLTAGGKRLRPVLLMACSGVCGEQTEQSIPFACAVEFIHTYSLIHDDLPCMDNDDYRRGKATNHKMFGEGAALLAGDGLLSAAFEVMTKDMLLYMDQPEQLNRRVRAAYEIAKGTGCRCMVAGQMSDKEAENMVCSKDMLSYIHSNKTAAFIKAAVLAGAYLGGADSRIIEKLGEYGDSIGLAFQIVDDIMDVISTLEERGKNVGGDAETGKATYPALYGLEESKKEALRLLAIARKSIEGIDNQQVLQYLIDYLTEQIQ